MPQRPHDTALGLARQRFVDSLPKAVSCVARSSPGGGSPGRLGRATELRARLRPPFASAQVFRMNVLAAALQEGAATLELARSEAREVSQAELDELTNLVATLPSLVDGVPNVRPSMVPAPSAPPSQPPPATCIAPLVNVGSTPPPALDAAPVSSPERPSARPVAR
ncbi:MAG: hypothetical protein IPN77_33700 [Sandaracinaceae bacterium]|nr:hypothetical protein [Sandaracinaceae bacterium]